MAGVPLEVASRPCGGNPSPGLPARGRATSKSPPFPQSSGCLIHPLTRRRRRLHAVPSLPTPPATPLLASPIRRPPRLPLRGLPRPLLHLPPPSSTQLRVSSRCSGVQDRARQARRHRARPGLRSVPPWRRSWSTHSRDAWWRRRPGHRRPSVAGSRPVNEDGGMRRTAYSSGLG